MDGASGEMKTLHVVNVSVEMAPVAKVGGMGDVVTALSRALLVTPLLKPNMLQANI